VALARAGSYDAALDLFTELRDEDPTNSALLHDYVAALSWAGRDADALSFVDDIDPSSAPLYVLLVMAKSARNLQQLELAENLYEHAIGSAPENLDGYIGLALTLADAKRYSQAMAVLDEREITTPGDTEVLQARAYVQVQSGELLAALRSHDAVLTIDPTNFDSLRGKALVLRGLLLPRQALDLQVAHPGILTNEEVSRLEADDLAIQLRLASTTIYPDRIDGQRLDATITAIERHLEHPNPREAELALRYDRITALAERNRAEEAIVAFEQLGHPPEQMPAYVLASAGRAYLQLRQPERAIKLLITANEMRPGNNTFRFALIYAYLDLDDYESVLAAEPMVLMANDSPIVKGNPERLQAEVIAAIADVSIAQLQAAQNRLESLLTEAPHNPDLRHELANVYRGRGWIDRSLFEYEQVLTMDEDQMFARVGRAYAQLDAQHFRDVDVAISELNRFQSSQPIVQRLTQTWTTHNRSELLVEASTGESTGSTFGSDVYTIDALWFTRPIRYNYRGFFHLHNSSADFPEGNAHRQRFGLGAEYRANRWTAAGEMLADTDEGGIGVSGSVGWRMSDLWLLSGALQLDGNDTQLRAYRAGIESDQLELAARYAPNESTGYAVGWRLRDYSDGNQGQTLFGELSRRILTRTKSTLDVTAELASSNNDLQNVPYFSPNSDLSYLVGLRHEWRIRRRYDRLLTQVAEVRVGQYDQSGFDTGNIWRASYALNIELSPNLFIRTGIQRSRMFYDGAAEFDTTLFATIQARL